MGAVTSTDKRLEDLYYLNDCEFKSCIRGILYQLDTELVQFPASRLEMLEELDKTIELYINTCTRPGNAFTRENLKHLLHSTNTEFIKVEHLQMLRKIMYECT